MQKFNYYVYRNIYKSEVLSTTPLFYILYRLGLNSLIKIA